MVLRTGNVSREDWGRGEGRGARLLTSPLLGCAAVKRLGWHDRLCGTAEDGMYAVLEAPVSSGKTQGSRWWSIVLISDLSCQQLS